MMLCQLLSGVANLSEQHAVYLLIVLMHVKIMAMQIFVGGIAEGISSEMVIIVFGLLSTSASSVELFYGSLH